VETVNITVADGSVTNGTGLSVTVAAGGPATLSLSAATTTPVAGAANNLSVTAAALDAYGNTATSYTGDKSLTFSGAGISPNGTVPTVSDKSGTPVNFGTATTITFVAGSSTVTGSSNGVMKLYKAEVANVTVSDGAIGSAPALSLTVSAGPASGLCILSATSCTGSTVSGGHSFTFTSHVGLIDQYGNTATAASSVTISVAQSGQGSGMTTSGSMVILAGQSSTPGTFTGTASSSGNKNATDTATSNPVLTSATVIQST
jgi:hypothetical protein